MLLVNSWTGINLNLIRYCYCCLRSNNSYWYWCYTYMGFGVILMLYIYRFWCVGAWYFAWQYCLMYITIFCDWCTIMVLYILNIINSIWFLTYTLWIVFFCAAYTNHSSTYNTICKGQNIHICRFTFLDFIICCFKFD